jgi:hypothetical protein
MLAVLVCVGVLSQQGTQGPDVGVDFSGRWALVVALPVDVNVPTSLTVHQSIRRANVRGEPMPPVYDTIEIQRDFGGRTTTDMPMIGIHGGVVGGVVNPTVNPRPTVRHVNSDYAVEWNGNTLVFEEGTYTGHTPGSGDWTARRETWALQPNGELAITIATSGSSDPARTISALFRRF